MYADKKRWCRWTGSVFRNFRLFVTIQVEGRGRMNDLKLTTLGHGERERQTLAAMAERRVPFFASSSQMHSDPEKTPWRRRRSMRTRKAILPHPIDAQPLALAVTVNSYDPIPPQLFLVVDLHTS